MNFAWDSMKRLNENGREKKLWIKKFNSMEGLQKNLWFDEQKDKSDEGKKISGDIHKLRDAISKISRLPHPVKIQISLRVLE